MLVLVLLCSLALVGLVHSAGYLLMLFEARAHGSAGAGAASGALWGAWLAEFGALLAVLALSAVSRLLRAPRPVQGTGRPVVLVHDLGAGHLSTAVWAARLKADGRTPVRVSHGCRSGGLDEAARELARELEEVRASTGAERLDVVGHGVGGLLVRVAAQRFGAARLLAHVVTLGCPHRGWMLASLAGGRRLAALRPDSPYLSRLALDPAPPESLQLTNLASSFDAVVFPPERAQWGAAMNVSIDYVGHYSMLFFENVYRLILENLGSVDPAADAR